jgi:hypothetical protein
MGDPPDYEPGSEMIINREINAWLAGKLLGERADEAAAETRILPRRQTRMPLADA